MFFCVLLNAQNIPKSEQAELYLNKVEHLQKMRKSGVILTVVGNAAAFAGIFGITYNHKDANTYDSSDKVNGRIDNYILLTSVGISATVGGIILSGIGARKARIYSDKYRGLNIGLISSPKSQGISLVYRF